MSSFPSKLLKYASKISTFWVNIKWFYLCHMTSEALWIYWCNVSSTLLSTRDLLEDGSKSTFNTTHLWTGNTVTCVTPGVYKCKSAWGNK